VIKAEYHRQQEIQTKDLLKDLNFSAGDAVDRQRIEKEAGDPGQVFSRGRHETRP